ncbi:unnamed protein product [Closterium sp. Yama58-4]|nr:unnamed protein product [Closterium sp. Yama58-4]
MVSRACSTAPPGLALLRRFRPKDFSFATHQIFVLILTFIAYALYHASRKPPSIVKGVLDPLDTGNSVTNNPWTFYLQRLETHPENALLRAEKKAGWAPFNGKNGKSLLGELDIAFLGCYAIGMYIAGHVGDRIDLRVFLSVGMFGSGLFVSLFGMGYFWDIHSLNYFAVVQMAAGFLQATGWPSVVAIMASWYGKKGRGLILGVWNAHTSVGNILGSLIASSALASGWGWAFLVPGFSIMAGALVMFLFLAPEPETIGLESPHSLLLSESSSEAGGSVHGEGDEESGFGAVECADVAADVAAGFDGTLLAPKEAAYASVSDQLTVPLLQGKDDAGPEGEGPIVITEDVLKAGMEGSGEEHEAISFWDACRIPGVAAYALCLFFAKLVAYTFLYWLPFYIKRTEIAGHHLSDAFAGVTSTVFDLGGVLGGIVAGHLSDHTGAHATVSASFMLLAIPSLLLYSLLGGISLSVHIGLLSLVGFFVNGPYALITCAVSADLGQHASLRGNSKGLATVTAIIDGTGSLGAALGPFLTGIVAEIGGGEKGAGDLGWRLVFAMLISAALAAVLCILRLVIGEFKAAAETSAADSDFQARVGTPRLSSYTPDL